MESKIKISIVIPTYCEKDNIEILIPKIVEIFNQNKIQGEIIIVDDKSGDGTAEIVGEFSKIYKRTCKIKFIEREGKMGLGSAYIEGFKRATGGIIFEMDGDLSHDPLYIPNFLKRIRECDLVIGSRYVRGGGINRWSFMRRLISRGANFIANRLIGLDIKDATSGYRAYKRGIIDELNMQEIKSNGYSFQVEMVYLVKKMGFRVAEIPIIFKDREVGKSKLGIKEVLRFFITVMRLSFNRYFRF